MSLTNTIKIERLLEESRKWRKHLSTLDSGSYCENGSEEYYNALKICKNYETIVDLLIKHEREFGLKEEKIDTNHEYWKSY